MIETVKIIPLEHVSFIINFYRSCMTAGTFEIFTSFKLFNAFYSKCKTQGGIRAAAIYLLRCTQSNTFRGNLLHMFHLGEIDLK